MSVFFSFTALISLCFLAADAAANSNKVRRLKASASSSAPAPAAASAPRSSDSERESSETPEPYEYMSDSSDDQREVRDEDLGEDDEEDAYLDSEDEVEDDEARAIAGEDQELFLWPPSNAACELLPTHVMCLLALIVASIVHMTQLFFNYSVHYCNLILMQLASAIELLEITDAIHV